MAAWRIGGSAIQRTQEAVTSPAVVEERRRLVARRLSTKPTPRQEYLQKKYGHLKPHQLCWELIKFFPVGKAFGFAAMTTVTVTYVNAKREIEMEKEEAKKKAKKKQEQSASEALKRQEAE